MNPPSRRPAWMEPLVLFGLGAVAVVAGPWISQPTGQPLLAALPAFVLSIVAGLGEAARARRTGQRRWGMSWLPAVLGMAAFLIVTYVWERTRGPWGVDSGMAWGIVLGAFLVVALVFAVLVQVVASLALHLAPPPAAP